MTPVVISQCAQAFLKKTENKSSTVVADEIGVNRYIVELWCQKYRNRSSGQMTHDIFSVSEGVAIRKKLPVRQKHGSSA